MRKPPTTPDVCQVGLHRAAMCQWTNRSRRTNLYQRRATGPAEQGARHWERSCDVRVTVENPKLTVHFLDGETLCFRFRWSPAVRGVEWLTEDLRALDVAPGWLVRAKARAMDGQGQEDR